MPRASRSKEAQSQSRSQGGAHSQPTQKRRGRVVEEEDEEDEEQNDEEQVDEEQNDEEEMEDAESEGEAKVGLSLSTYIPNKRLCNQTVDRKANDLVRLALSTEYRRTALRRDEIAKKSNYYLMLFFLLLSLNYAYSFWWTCI